MGAAVPLLTTRVWVLCGGDGTVSTGTGLLSAGVGVRRGVAGSLSNWVGYNLRESGLCEVDLVLGQVQPWFYLHQLVALSFLKTVLLLPQILPSLPPIEMADKQEK